MLILAWRLCGTASHLIVPMNTVLPLSTLHERESSHLAASVYFLFGQGAISPHRCIKRRDTALRLQYMGISLCVCVCVWGREWPLCCTIWTIQEVLVASRNVGSSAVLPVRLLLVGVLHSSRKGRILNTLQQVCLNICIQLVLYSSIQSY